jgi:hypothetical protein
MMDGSCSRIKLARRDEASAPSTSNQHAFND